MREASWVIAGCLVSGVVLASSVPTAAASDRETSDEGPAAAFARASALEAAGHPSEAAATLEALFPLYPQDYALALRIAGLRTRAGQLALAERAYRVALRVSPRGVDARVGLAATLEAEGRSDEAAPLWVQLADELPDLSVAQRGRARTATIHVSPLLALEVAAFPSHPYKSYSAGVLGGVWLSHRSGFFVGGDYRYTHFVPASGTTLAAWDQHEGYAGIGYATALAELGVYYGVVYDGSGLFGTSHHVGFDARWSPLGDLDLTGTASFYGDMDVLRLSPSWRIPVAFGLSITPAVAIADAGGTALVTGMGTIALDRASFSLWAGAKYGDEVRPVYLSVPVVYDVPERISYGAWGGASVNVTKGARIHLSYAMDRLEQPDGTATNAHALSLGASASF